VSKFLDTKREKQSLDNQVKLKQLEQSIQRRDWQTKETLDAARHIYRYVVAWANHASEGARYVFELSNGRPIQPSIPPDLPPDNTMEIATLALLANLKISEEFYGFTARCEVFSMMVASALEEISLCESSAGPAMPFKSMATEIKSISDDISERALRFQQLINAHFRID
jgi:hypothetical protein